ncbi:MAG: hypothetical protein IPM66_00810 [Acidobacteriota bacterium]|nr:MAG: hypothetical protein IPM66_00810 [Acidobacteriota bacterium]
MDGIIVTGDISLIDADVVRFFRYMKSRFGEVWVMPTTHSKTHAASLNDIDYILRQLTSVRGVLSSTECLQKTLPVAQHPFRLSDRISTTTLRPISDDDEVPTGYSINNIFEHRPQPLIMVSGCFDLIHAGHVRLIETAADYGYSPVVAMLTTLGIRRQPKNIDRSRPIWTMADRVTVIEELRYRPVPLLFDGPDCLELIAALRPDIWVKSTRDRGRSIVEKEARMVENYGGLVVWAEEEMIFSSSEIIETLGMFQHKH